MLVYAGHVNPLGRDKNSLLEWVKSKIKIYGENALQETLFLEPLLSLEKKEEETY